MGSKALFAGGTNGIVPSDVVDIFDSAADTWSTATLSQGNTPSASVTVGAKALFAGGQPLSSSRVEIYDATTGRWSRVDLSQARYYPVGTPVGTKAFFAGGGSTGVGFSDVVDVYDSVTGRWSTMKLPVAAQFAVATTVDGKAVFAGGTALNKHGNEVDSDLVEIYDVRTGRWSTARLSQARSDFAVANIGNVALFAGGAYDNRHGTHVSDVVDIYDAKTGQWSTTSLALARAGLSGTAVGDTAIFAGGDVPDPSGVSKSVLDAVDLFTLDNVPPTPVLVSAPTIDHSIKTYTFTVSYHDLNRIDLNSLDDNDIFVTGPIGFNHRAQFVSQTRGKHGSTRVVTYAVRGRGLHWDSTENGSYTIRLHSAQISDVAGNAARGDDLGAFRVVIPIPPQTSSLPATPYATSAFQTERKIGDPLWQ